MDGPKKKSSQNEKEKYGMYSLMSGLSNKESSWGDVQNSLGRGNRGDFISEQRVGWDGNMSDQVVCGMCRESTEGDFWKAGRVKAWYQGIS